jgi:hypothetical protein
MSPQRIRPEKKIYWEQNKYRKRAGINAEDGW